MSAALDPRAGALSIRALLELLALLQQPPGELRDRIWTAWSGARRELGEVGVGDTVHAVLSRFDSPALRLVIASLLGRADCGCAGRQRRLNELYPY